MKPADPIITTLTIFSKGILETTSVTMEPEVTGFLDQLIPASPPKSGDHVHFVSSFLLEAWQLEYEFSKKNAKIIEILERLLYTTVTYFKHTRKFCNNYTE